MSDRLTELRVYRAEGRAELRIPLRPVAEQLFEAHFAEMIASERVINVLFLAFGDGWDDYTADYYDNSIEVYGSDLSAAEAPEILRVAGFSRAWFHELPCSKPHEHGCGCRYVALWPERSVSPTPPPPSETK